MFFYLEFPTMSSNLPYNFICTKWTFSRLFRPIYLPFSTLFFYRTFIYFVLVHLNYTLFLFRCQCQFV